MPRNSDALFVDMQFPLAGLDLTLAFDEQRAAPMLDGRPAQTTLAGVNVRAFEPLTERARGGSRPGLWPYIVEQIPQTTPLEFSGYPGKIQHLNIIVDPQYDALEINFEPGVMDSPGIGVPDISSPTATTWPFGLRNGPGTDTVTGDTLVTRYVRDGGSALQPNRHTTTGDSSFAPYMDWSDPETMGAGERLSSDQLNCVARDSTVLPLGTGSELLGNYVYSPREGKLMLAGLDQPLSVVFYPDDKAMWSKGNKTVHVDVAKTATRVLWDDPGDITVGTALSATQLNATGVSLSAEGLQGGAVSGDMSYNPPSGTVLSAGSYQALRVVFTPSDTITYARSRKTVHINVLSAGGVSFVSGKARTFAGTSAHPSSFNFMPGLVVHSGGAVIIAVGAGQFTNSGSPSKIAPSAITDTNSNTYTKIKDMVGHFNNPLSLWAAYNCAADTAGSAAFTITYPQAMASTLTGLVVFGSFDGVLTSGNPSITLSADSSTVSSVSQTLSPLTMPSNNGGLMVAALMINSAGSSTNTIGIPIGGSGSFTQACQSGYYIGGVTYGGPTHLDECLALMYQAPSNASATPTVSNPDAHINSWDWIVGSFKHT